MALIDLDNLSEADRKLIISKAMSELGKTGGQKGGKSKSKAKQAASKANGKLGGRPITAKRVLAGKDK